MSNKTPLNILSDQQELVYRATLELGAAPVQAIANHAHIPRTSVYLYLEELKEKGLVSEKKEGKKTLFIAEHPRALVNLIERYKSGLHREQHKIFQEMPQLEALYNVQADKPLVRFYEGFEGLKAVHELTLATQEMLVICSGYVTPIPAELDEYLEQYYFKTIHAKNIATKEIVTKDMDLDHYIAEYSSEINEIRIAKRQPAERHLDKVIFGNSVATIAYDSMQATVIEHKDIAQFERDIFMQLWETLL